MDLQFVREESAAGAIGYGPVVTVHLTVVVCAAALEAAGNSRSDPFDLIPNTMSISEERSAAGSLRGIGRGRAALAARRPRGRPATRAAGTRCQDDTEARRQP